MGVGLTISFQQFCLQLCLLPKLVKFKNGPIENESVTEEEEQTQLNINKNATSSSLAWNNFLFRYHILKFVLLHRFQQSENLLNQTCFLIVPLIGTVMYLGC